MMHTAEIASGITDFPIDVLFNAADPSQSPAQVYESSGTFDNPDGVDTWLSATVNGGDTINVGQTKDLTLRGGQKVKGTVRTEPGNPHHIFIQLLDN